MKKKIIATSLLVLALQSLFLTIYQRHQKQEKAKQRRIWKYDYYTGIWEKSIPLINFEDTGQGAAVHSHWLPKEDKVFLPSTMKKKILLGAEPIVAILFVLYFHNSTYRWTQVA